MGRDEEERMLFQSFAFVSAESFTEAADTSGSVGSCVTGDGEQKKARQRRRRKPKPASEGEAVDEQAKKRRLSDEQARFLEINFRKERKLETPRKMQLAAELGLDAKQVAVWFQNRRARHKSKLMEEEFTKLRAAHDAVVLQNCHLETEVLKLKDRLAEAEAEEDENKLIAAVVERQSAAARAAAAPTAMAPGASPSTVQATEPEPAQQQQLPQPWLLEPEKDGETSFPPEHGVLSALITQVDRCRGLQACSLLPDLADTVASVPDLATTATAFL